MKSTLAVISTALLSASLATAVCVKLEAALEAAEAARAETPLAIGYVTKSATNQGWILINKGAADAASEAHVRLFVGGPSAQGALAGQIDAVERVIAQGAKAIALAPVDSSGIIPIVQRATANGIPFIAVDTAINDESAKSYVATDNVAAARAEAEWVGAAVGDTDEVILVNGSLSQSTGRDRRQGFLNRFKQLKPNAVVHEVYTDWTEEEAPGRRCSRAANASQSHGDCQRLG
jgi:ABC-type sugar transport system substrate-binding protein